MLERKESLPIVATCWFSCLFSSLSYFIAPNAKSFAEFPPDFPPDQGSSKYSPAEFGLTYDATFVATSEQTASMHLETLEARLGTAQSRLAKEAIRTAYLALAEHHRLRGELRESLRKVIRSREYCTTIRQSGQVCLLVIELGIDCGNYAQVRDYVAKAEHTPDLLHADPLLAAKVRVASGLVYLHDGRYAEAARKFASVPPELTHQFSTVVSAEDIALYGSLLGLASFDRSELRSLILDAPAFKARLELVPPLRDALRHYLLAEYGPALSTIRGLMDGPDSGSDGLLRLDLHLRPHLDALYGLIRDRCVVQYFSPYSKVSIATMGEGFGLPVAEMEAILAHLIKCGKIGDGPGTVRINSLNKTVARESAGRTRSKGRAATRHRVSRLGANFLSETEGLLLRLSCLKNDIVVGDRGHGRRFGGMGGSGGEKERGMVADGGASVEYLHDIYDASSDEEVMEVDTANPEEAYVAR